MINAVKKRVRGALLSATAAVAVSAPSANADMCAIVLCLNNTMGDLSAVCQQMRMPFFNIQVWTPNYNASATSQAREAFLWASCPLADQDNIDYAINTYGELMVDPGY